MEILGIQNFVHTSPRKLRLVADMVRKMSALQAIKTLQFTNKSAALPLSKTIKTVIANATQQGLNAEDLIFKKLEINGGMMMKRVRAAGRGRRKPYVKKTSQIKIVLTNEKPSVKIKETKIDMKEKKEEVKKSA